ncbi:MAG: calcium/sodium antiporter [Oligoflexia bacterium]|nr:calcium/sodium antiporter [Oligoflexia bacterium]
MLNFIFLFVGLICLLLGSHWLVKSLKGISLYFKLKPLFLSIVVLGFVSSSPEYFVTLNAGFKGLSSAALGNILGSNVINILLVLALAGLFYGFTWRKHIVYFDMSFLIFGTLLLGLCSIDKNIGALDGLSLLAVFIIYMIFLFKQRKEEKNETADLPPSFSLLKALAVVALGFVFLFIGSSLAVDSSLKLVKAFSLSEKFAGVFILSLSTSLPELATSLQAVFKKEGEMALGSVVGSNLFNTLFVLGSASLLKPLQFPANLYSDYFFMSFVTVVLFLSLLFFKTIPKALFAGFIISYFVYISFVSGIL